MDRLRKEKGEEEREERGVRGSGWGRKREEEGWRGRGAWGEAGDRSGRRERRRELWDEGG